MKAVCVGCGKNLGTVTGKLLKGYVLLCAQCNDKRKAAEWARGAKPQVDMPDFFKDIFKGGK